MAKVSVIIPTCNNIKRTQVCISCLRLFGSNYLSEIIVVDNNSSDGTIEWLEAQEDIRVIYNAVNLGLSKAYNQGAQIATGEYFLFMHNDVYITPNVLTRLLQTMQHHPRIGVSGVYTNRCRYIMQLIREKDAYDNFDSMVSYAKNLESDLQADSAMVLESFFLLTKREAYEKVGGFDEAFIMPGVEDFDFTLRVQQAGFSIYLDAAFVHHDNNSFELNNLNCSHVYEENSRIFQDKWDVSPAYSILVRRDILDLLDNVQKVGLTVLDVGCSCGGNLMYIKKRNATARLYGIELNPHTAAVAANYGEVYAEDLEKIHRPEWQGKFDYIICGDILEHLYDPWTVVQKLADLLKDGGSMLVSLPNIGFVGEVYNLLNGHFQYKDAGILDRTHLRFFTHESACQMLEAAGLVIKKQVKTTMGLSREQQNFYEGLINNPQYSGRKDELLAYQWIFKARKE